MEKSREFGYNDHHFEVLRTLTFKHAGIKLSDAKKELVYSRIVRRLRILELNSFSEYCRLLKTNPEQEIDQFINAITTNKTEFFREPHHFDFLAKTAIPQLIKEKEISRKIRIWSAGCSTGQEPYSIAIILKEIIPNLCNWDVRILATDIDSNVLKTAKQGIYKGEQLTGVSKTRLKQWFKKGKSKNMGKFKISPELKKLVYFKQLNLLEQWPMHGPFDLLFCRNTVIYFDKPTQKKLFVRFSELLLENNYLFIGHSESLFSISENYQHLGQTIHRKVA